MHYVLVTVDYFVLCVYALTLPYALNTLNVNALKRIYTSKCAYYELCHFDYSFGKSLFFVLIDSVV